MSDNCKYWHPENDGKIRCELCPRNCVIAEGKRGFCYVRGNINGEMQLLTYGRSSGFCIDPIEKKPLNHFYPGTPTLSFGTAGCNLACKFCQNWDLSNAQRSDLLNQEASPLQIATAAKKHQCKSIAFTYNDPIIFLEYAKDVAVEAHRLDIKTVAVTAGYIAEKAREEFFSFIDAANIDLKAFTDSFYKKLTGAHLDPILETLLYLKHETNIWFEITTMLIPGENDSTQEIENMAEWIIEKLGPDVPIHFTAFHPTFKLNTHQCTSLETLTNARRIAQKAGIRYVYTGNVHDPQSSSSYCHNCGELLIGRDWYQLSTWNLDSDGSCQKCKTPLAGFFDPQPGDWGAQRLPVRI